MEAIIYNYVDKSEWTRGEWDDEPDKVQFQDHETGLPCLIVRGNSGALCGYVGVTQDHPFYGRDYDDVPVNVHWGLTFSDRCQHREDHTGICHIPCEGEPDNVWWLGFDCAHSGDFCPSYSDMYGFPGDVYRNIEFVKSEVECLARQIWEEK